MSLREQTWVLLGAGGDVGRSLRPELAARVGRLRLVDVTALEPAHPNEEAVIGDVRDQHALDVALRHANGVVHLGGLADEDDFHDLAEINIVGTYHVFEAARRAGARRVVYASSNRATGFYSTDTLLDASMPPRPDGLYGVSKVAGEALGRLYADKFGLEVAALRIGSFEPTPQDQRQLSTWLSPADCLAAFLAAMTAPELSYAVFYAVSRNTRRWWDLADGQALGFDPSDDAEDHAPRSSPSATKTSGSVPQGGPYTTPAYTLDRQR